MSSGRTELPARDDMSGGVAVYCLTSLMVEEARRQGCGGFAKALENNLADLLASLSRSQQGQALRLSYEMAMAGEEPSQPRLRLVYSRG